MASVRLFWQGPKGTYGAISQEKVRSTVSLGPPTCTKSRTFELTFARDLRRVWTDADRPGTERRDCRLLGFESPFEQRAKGRRASTECRHPNRCGALRTF